MDHQLLKSTSEHFDAINFNELNERWIEEVIDNEFTDVGENNMTPSILFTKDPIETLNNVCIVCEAWCNKSPLFDMDDSDVSSSRNVTSKREEVLWTYLNEMDISIKQIQVAIYFLCNKAVKTSSSLDEKELGLLSAKLYFSCLRVPGSSAYSVFYPNLFRLCIDCLPIPDHIENRDTVYKWKHFEELMPMFVSTLKSLVPLLSVFHLGNDSSTADHTIRKLSELVGSELGNANLDLDLDFLTMPDRERRRLPYSTAIATLAFQGLTNLLNSDLNSDKEHTYEFTLSCLNRHVLCSRVRKSSTIQAKFIVIKDNCVLFMCRNLKNSSDLCSPLTVTSLKRLCLTVSDKAEFRTTVSQAVFNIMFHLQLQNLTEFIQWILQLVDSSEMNNRVFALEIMGHLLGNVPKVDTEGLDESLKVYLTPVPVIFAILTRCDDVSPNVRTKALSVLAQHMKRVLNVLMEMQDPSTFPTEHFEEDVESDMNGDHRSFWYNFDSFRSMLDEIAGILHRRIEDNNGTARKAALQALENIITFDLEYLSEDNLKLFVLSAKDPNIVIRKQMIQSLTTVLETYHSNIQSQEYWLKCILPLVQDPENSVQAKVLSVLDEKFLNHIFSTKDEERNCAFSLLGKLSCGEFLSHQRYLQKAFSLWKIENKLKPQDVTLLEKYLGGGKDELLWFYLSIFSTYCKPPSSICELAVQEFEKPLNWESYSFMDNILKILGSIFSSLSSERLGVIRGILMEKLQDFAAPVEILPMMIDILCKLETRLKKDEDFLQFASTMIKSSVDILTPFVTKGLSKKLPSEDTAIKCFTVIKELCQIFPEHITQHLLKVLKSFVYSALMGEGLSEKQSEISKRITPPLRAHAYAALGKICLQDEDLAKDLLPILAKEVMSYEQNVIRNNVVIILIEMCKRYTSYADKYVPLISMCFKDQVYLIRYQTITLLVSLLQEDYIKWKGPLFFCLLSTLIDKKEAIQELGKYCLCQLLYEKRKSVFADNFVDSIFVFNHFVPPDNERLAEIVRELDRFSLKGDSKQEQRMQIYKFMLSYMEPGSRAYLVKALCQELLASVAEAVFPLNKVTESMVKDCFAIISSREIRAYDTDSLANEVEESEEENAAKAELVARKLMIVEPVIPVMISLKNCVMDGKSDLLADIVMFLKDILHDYQNEIETLLRDDKMLLMQVKFEVRNEMMQQEKQAKEKNKKEARMQQTVEPPTRHQIAEKSKETTAYLIQQGRESIGNPANRTVTNADKQSEVSLRLLPKTLLAKSSQVQSDTVVEDLYPQGSILVSTETGTRMMPQFSSTPRVVLKQLTAMELPNVSRICFEDENKD